MVTRARRPFIWDVFYFEEVRKNGKQNTVLHYNRNIKSFDRTARKYGIDYAVKKDRLSTPPKYLVFFKSRDADAMMAAFTEFSKRTLRKEKQKQSVKKTLEAFKKLIKEKGLDKVKELVKGERER